MSALVNYHLIPSLQEIAELMKSEFIHGNTLAFKALALLLNYSNYNQSWISDREYKHFIHFPSFSSVLIYREVK